MKKKWYLLILLTVLAGLSLTAMRVEAAALDFYGGMQLNDGGDGGQPDEPAECFPVTLCDDGGGTDGGDGGDAEPAE